MPIGGGGGTPVFTNTINFKGLSGIRDTLNVNLADTLADIVAAIIAIEGLNGDYYADFILDRDNTISFTNNSGDTYGNLGLENTDTLVAILENDPSIYNKEQRQLQKLEISEVKRAANSNTRAIYDISQLPNPYNGNDVDPDDNPNTGGLVEGRPWVVGNPAPVTQDLILFFDSERTDCYPGTGTTIYNLVDNTPSTLGGNFTYSDGVIRLNNNTGNMLENTARINCQTVTNFRTISLWYRQVSDGGNVTRYILDAREGVGGGYIYTGDPYGPAWEGSTMYEDGGVGVQVNYTEQIGTWRNLTLVNTAPMTDDITLFSRYSNDEGLDVEFGACMIYNRAITYEENLQNFNQFKTRYGL